jgi:hypothetical protein
MTDHPITQDVSALMQAVSSLSNSIAHDERAYQEARRELPDLEITRNKLNRLVESLSR